MEYPALSPPWSEGLAYFSGVNFKIYSSCILFASLREAGKALTKNARNQPYGILEWTDSLVQICKGAMNRQQSRAYGRFLSFRSPDVL